MEIRIPEEYLDQNSELTFEVHSESPIDLINWRSDIQALEVSPEEEEQLTELIVKLGPESSLASFLARLASDIRAGDDPVLATVGNDGLTHQEREAYANSYNSVMSKKLSASEAEAVKQWLAKKRS